MTEKLTPKKLDEMISAKVSISAIVQAVFSLFLGPIKTFGCQVFCNYTKSQFNDKQYFGPPPLVVAKIFSSSFSHFEISPTIKITLPIYKNEFLQLMTHPNADPSPPLR